VSITLDEKNTSEETIELVSDVIVETTTKIMEDTVVIGNFGATAYDKEDKNDVGYYLLQWTSTPFHWTDDYHAVYPDAPREVKNGDAVASVVLLHEISRAKHWYRVSDEKGLVMMQYTVSADVKMIIGSEGNPLPPRLPIKKNLIPNKLYRLPEDEHLKITDEINRREAIDIEKVIYDETSDDGSCSSDA
jgi:hypothetical protein